MKSSDRFRTVSDSAVLYQLIPPPYYFKRGRLLCSAIYKIVELKSTREVLPNMNLELTYFSSSFKAVRDTKLPIPQTKIV